jgi:hypothetical protein
LDTLHFELEGMKSRKVWLCEQLKNWKGLWRVLVLC